ncbi:MAG: pyridoxamine 5'-phosphate oxidase family protein [Acidimicrobiia bacterium]
MAERAPRLTENCTYQYDNNALQPPDPNAIIPWADGLERLSAARTYWFATARPDGRPHLRPVLAVWVDGAICTTSNPDAGKGRNLATNNHCTLGASTGEIDFIVEGTAARVTDHDVLERIAAIYHAKYGWPVTVTGSAFDAPYGAPAAGPPPYQPYAITPQTVYGFGTEEEWAPRSTRWRF